ncbi:MAG: 16S rRNA (uracil(1498)-N(3))-methyltransferase [Phycisphaeraceae bacterium]|nr:16S rRNA (uracil(1498)-N(3))-methyltransferase [Phycisphaeraceae bacterium]
MPAAWFHVDSMPAVDSAALLDAKEAKHAVGSRRLAPGDRVMLFDGFGTVAEAVLTGDRAAGGDLEVEVGTSSRVAPPSPRIELAASLPKGDRMSTMLDMATQIGMSAFRPLNCDHSVITADKKRRDPSDRWRRVMLEACKQSRRAWMPELLGAASPAEVVADAEARGAMVVMGDADGTAPNTIETDADVVVVLVGPEGGFSPTEFGMLKTQGVVPIRIGDGVLRVEAAAVTLVAAMTANRPAPPSTGA